MNNKVNRFLLYANPLLLAKLMMKRQPTPPPPVTEKYFRFNLAFTQQVPSTVEKIKIFIGNQEREISNGEQFILKENETLSWNFIGDAPEGLYHLSAYVYDGGIEPTYLNVFAYKSSSGEEQWTSDISKQTSETGVSTGKLVEGSFTKFEDYPSGSTITIHLVASVTPVVDKFFRFKVNFPPTMTDPIKVFVGNREQTITAESEPFIVKNNETLKWDFANTPPTGQWFLAAGDVVEETLTTLDIFRSNGLWISSIFNQNIGTGDISGTLVDESFTKYSAHPTESIVNLYLSGITPQQDFVYVALTNENWVNTNKKIYINGTGYDVPEYQQTTVLDDVKLHVGDTIGFTADGEPTGNQIFAVAYLDDSYDATKAAKVFDCSKPTTSDSMLNIAEIQTCQSGGAYLVANQMKLRTDAFDREARETEGKEYLESGRTIYVDCRDNQSLLGEFVKNPLFSSYESKYDIKVTLGGEQKAYIRTDEAESQPVTLSMNKDISQSSKYVFSFVENSSTETRKTRLVAYNEPATVSERTPAYIFNVGGTRACYVESDETREITIGYSELERFSIVYNVFFEWEPVENVTGMKTVHYNMKKGILGGCGYDLDVLENLYPFYIVPTDMEQSQEGTFKFMLSSMRNYKVKFAFNNSSLKHTKISAYTINGSQREAKTIFKNGENHYSEITSVSGSEYDIDLTQLTEEEEHIYFEWEPEGTLKTTGYCIVKGRTEAQTGAVQSNKLYIGRVKVNIDESERAFGPCYLERFDLLEFEDKTGTPYWKATAYKTSQMEEEEKMFIGNNSETETSTFISLNEVTGEQNKQVQVLESATQSQSSNYIYVTYVGQ